jgi:flagellar basal body-associated protein FliL
MKLLKTSAPRLTRFEFISRILEAIAIILALSLIGGTVYTLVFHNKKEKREDATIESSEALSPEKRISGDEINQNGQIPPPGELDGIFTGIGRIRASTSTPETATVILSIAFPYPSTDKAFSSELAARIGDFRGVTMSYFESFSVDELRQKNEAAIKTELLKRFNDLLRLGEISTLYFSDYLIIE